MYTTSKQLYRHTDEFLNKEILVAGWVRTVRSSGDVAFIELNDGSFKGLQIVLIRDCQILQLWRN